MFEWDEVKSSQNLSKRGFDFDYVSMIFDGDIIERVDDRHDYQEERIIALGEIDTEIYCVVYTWRYKKRRIISARAANRKERNDYYRTFNSRHTTP
ncbi:MAG TPA: BrnT family toxin [Skermanella sp.]|jgi:uncharacterized protein|nr:BrnT family toxin [Skermanella sp.]